MSAVFAAVRRTNRYVSMRVHGTSAQIQFEQPDSPDKIIDVTRISQGTQITANFQANVSAFFSIPTPLIVERSTILQAFIDLTRTNDPVFKGTSIRVVHIELYLAAQQMALGQFRATDGNRIIKQAKMTDMLIVGDDEFSEDTSIVQASVHRSSIDRRIYTALGVSFDMGFNMVGPGVSNILLIGAKAIFLS